MDAPYGHLGDVLTAAIKGESLDLQRFSPDETSYIFRQIQAALVTATLFAEDALRSKETQRFLSEASMLLNTSLDYETTLKNIARAAIPYMSDWIAVDLLDKTGELQQLVLAHKDPAKQKTAEALRSRILPTHIRPNPTLDVVRSGKSLLIPEINESIYSQLLPDDADYEVLREFKITSALLVPILFHGQSLGVMTFCNGDSGRMFTKYDQNLAEELGQRIAAAIQNTRLFQEVNESRQRYHVTLASIGDAVIATDEKGIIEYINPAAQNLTGWNSKEAIGKKLDDLISFANHPLTDHENSPFKKIMLEYDGTWPASQTILTRQDGRKIMVEDSSTLIRGADGQIVGAVMVFRDVTERKRAEIAQKEATQRTNLLYDLTAALSEALTVEQVGRIIMDKAIQDLGADLGGVGLLAKDGIHLQMLNFTNVPGSTSQNYTIIPLAHRMPITDSARDNIAIFIDSARDYQMRYPQLNDTRENTGSHAAATLPLSVDGKVIGALGLAFHRDYHFTAEDCAFLIALSHHCAQTLQRARLYQNSQELAVLEERQRLARDLHDAVSQTLFASSTLAESLLKMPELDTERGRKLLTQVHRLNRAAFAEMRNLLTELRPDSLQQMSIAELLKQLAYAAMGRKQFEMNLQLDDSLIMPEGAKNAFYRIAQEGLNNIVKHAQADNVLIVLEKKKGQYHLRIQDDGDGFELKADSSGLGLKIMQERAANVGAALEITSKPREGATLHLVWSAPQTASLGRAKS